MPRYLNSRQLKNWISEEAEMDLDDLCQNINEDADKVIDAALSIAFGEYAIRHEELRWSTGADTSTEAARRSLARLAWRDLLNRHSISAQS